ncbi:MAG: TetR/AcrR family transcriptional regulator [Candidatus Sericytochromatia bacterium]
MTKKTNIQRSTETKEKLLYSTAKIIIEKGLSKLTLDEVSKESGISKGGLLHHFKSKDALIYDLASLAIKKWEEIFESFYAKETEEKGKFMRAYIKSALEQESSDKELLFSNKVWMAIITELFENPLLLEIFKKSKLMDLNLISKDGLDMETINIIRLTVDGLMINELFHTPLEAQDRKKLEERLLEMTRK